MDTRVLTAHVPLDLAERVDEISGRLQRSRGWIMKQALADWVAKQDHGAARRYGFAEAQTPFGDLVPGTDTQTPAARAVEALKTLREATTLGEVDWRDLRDAGRRG